MVTQKAERTIAVIAAGVGILIALAGVVSQFSSLQTRVEQLERSVEVLVSAKGSRGDLCAQIMSTHLQAISAGDVGKAEVLSAELDRFQCTKFELATEPLEQTPQ